LEFSSRLSMVSRLHTNCRLTAQIISQQNASSGMWAAGEGLEELYLLVFFYLLWPICFNVVGRLPKLWASSQKT
jgi:hypothetical protein